MCSFVWLGTFCLVLQVCNRIFCYTVVSMNCSNLLRCCFISTWNLSKFTTEKLIFPWNYRSLQHSKMFIGIIERYFLLYKWIFCNELQKIAALNIANFFTNSLLNKTASWIISESFGRKMPQLCTHLFEQIDQVYEAISSYKTLFLSSYISINYLNIWISLKPRTLA